MNNLQYGFFDELAKIAAYEMANVRPEVSKEIAKRVRERYYTMNQAPGGNMIEAPRIPNQPPYMVTLSRNTAQRGRAVGSFDMRRASDAAIVGRERMDIADKKGKLLPEVIKEYIQQQDKINPHYYKNTHLPGKGRHEEGWSTSSRINPWGDKINVPKRPPMPVPVKR